MVWGTAPVYGHLGLDLTGPTGGVVRIDDIVVEDVTAVFHRKLMDWVDVRDYGAIGNGLADDAAAFEAADSAAAGREVLVSAGNYYLRVERHLRKPGAVRGDGVDACRPHGWPARGTTTSTPMRRPSAPSWWGSARRCRRCSIFTDHVTLDLSGRRIDLTEPIDVAARGGDHDLCTAPGAGATGS